jgi:hypothetical protein
MTQQSPACGYPDCACGREAAAAQARAQARAHHAATHVAPVLSHLAFTVARIARESRVIALDLHRRGLATKLDRAYHRGLRVGAREMEREVVRYATKLIKEITP